MRIHPSAALGPSLFTPVFYTNTVLHEQSRQTERGCMTREKRDLCNMNESNVTLYCMLNDTVGIHKQFMVK